MRQVSPRASRLAYANFILLLSFSAVQAVASPGPSGSTPPNPTDHPPAAKVVKVTWADLVRLVDRHPRLGTARFQIDAARAGVTAAGGVPNPSLETTVGLAQDRSGVTSRVAWGLALNIPLGWIAGRRSKMAAAEAEVEVAVAESQALRRDVLHQLGALFWNLASEQARVSSLEELETQISAVVSLVQRQVEKGDIRPVQATRIEIEAGRVAIEVEAARKSLASRRALLALWLGMPRGQTPEAVADPNRVPAAMSLEVALAKLRVRHPALAVARAKLRALEADVVTEKRARLPAFSFTLFTSHDLDQRAYGAGLSVELPLWSWNSGRIAQARAKVAASLRQTQTVALELESSVIELQAACRASVMTATRLGTQVVPRAEIAASAMTRAYQLGDATLLEVIDARRTLLETRRLVLGARAQAQIDCSRLGALVGEEPR